MIVVRLLFLILVGSLPANVAFAGTGQDLLGMMKTFQSNIGPLYTFVVALAYVMGLWFVADSIFRFKKFAQARTMMSTQASFGKPLILLAIGVALIYLPTFVQTSIQSFWAYSSSNSVLKYPQEPSLFDAFVHPLIDTIRLFGLIAVVRGLVIMTKLASESHQPGTAGKGIMHIIAGTFAINIVGTINVIRGTFGF